MRSAELHYYAAGGSVADPSHRDQGSLLTLSVLLSEPSEYEGGVSIGIRMSMSIRRQVGTAARGGYGETQTHTLHGVRCGGRGKFFVIHPGAHHGGRAATRAGARRWTVLRLGTGTCTCYLVITPLRPVLRLEAGTCTHTVLAIPREPNLRVPYSRLLLSGLTYFLNSEQRHNVSTVEATPTPNPNSNPNQRHNVSTVEAGVRRSFVLELWGGPPNARNRHS